MTAPPPRRQNAGWRRIVAGSLTSAAVALSVGVGAGTAHAADVIDLLVSEYTTGTGGGQVSNLLNEVVTLRGQGIPPRPADLVAVQNSLQSRPNQMRLIGALSATVQNQRKMQSRMAGQQGGQPGAGIGVNMEPWNPSGNPMIQDNPAFPMPGRS
jgi:hypothetical protein